MKKYSRVLAGILAVLLSAGCTGLYAAAQSDSSSAVDSTASTTKNESDKKIQKIQRKLISLTVIQKSRLRKKQFMLSLTLPATRQKQSFPTG